MLTPCCGPTGSVVTVTDTPLNTIIVVDGVPSLLPKLKTCAGADQVAGARVPTCTEMNTAIANAIAAIPDDDNQIITEGLGIDVTGPTGANNNYTVAAKVSTAAGNELTVGANGLYVAAAQANILFENEGVALGTAGTVNDIDFVGGGVTASRVGNTLTVTVPGGLSTVAADGVTIIGNGTVASPLSVPSDKTTPLASIAGLVAADRGVSLGEVDIPTNRALTIAEMTQVNTDNVGLNFRDMQAIYTNKAVEPTAIGMMNANGQLGNYSHVIANNADQTVAGAEAVLDELVNRYNGGHARLIITAGDTINVPDPRYAGQILHIHIDSVAVSQSEVDLQFTGAGVGGTYRKPNRVIRPGGGGDLTLRARNGEDVELVALNTSTWVVRKHNYRLFFGPTWREHEDGKISIWFSASLASTADVVQAVTTPVICANLLAARVQITDAVGGKNIGDPITGSEAAHVFVHAPIASTTQIGVGMREAANTGLLSDFVGFVNFHVEGATLDYTAYGTGF